MSKMLSSRTRAKVCAQRSVQRKSLRFSPLTRPSAACDRLLAPLDRLLLALVRVRRPRPGGTA